MYKTNNTHTYTRVGHWMPNLENWWWWVKDSIPTLPTYPVSTHMYAYNVHVFSAFTYTPYNYAYMHKISAVTIIASVPSSFMHIMYTVFTVHIIILNMHTVHK